MAKIVFLGNFNVPYSSETHHATTLESMGHEVVRLQESVSTSDVIRWKASKADLFVWVHTHGWETGGSFSMAEVLDYLGECGVPSMTYHLDLWFGLRRQVDLQKEDAYTHIEHFFTVDNYMAKWFNENTNVRGHYLPAGVFDQECYIANEPISRDIVFVGSRRYHAEWPYRPKLVTWLERTYKNRFEHWGPTGRGLVRGDDLNRLYASTKIVVGDTLCPNFSYESYWSDRVYETMGRGGFIIHPYIRGMEKEFEDRKHLVFYEYKNFTQLKSLIDYYIENDDERESIRLAGHNLVKEKYTYKNRWEYILKELGI